MRVTVYRAQDGWRWQGIADTGEIVRDSAEAYEDKFHAIDAAKQFRVISGEQPLLFDVSLAITHRLTVGDRLMRPTHCPAFASSIPKAPLLSNIDDFIA
jgi:hypothetical protein